MTERVGLPVLSEDFSDRLAQRKRRTTVFRGLCLAATCAGILALATLFYDVIGSAFTFAAVQPRELRGEQVLKVVETWSLWEGLWNRSALEAEVAENYPEARLQFYSWLRLDFLTSYPSRFPEISGFRSPILGSLMVISFTALLAFPIGVGTAIYLEEYGGRGRVARVIETNIANLAGVDSIIFGLLGLAIFVRAWEGFTGGRTILAGALVLTLVSLPVIIIASREALRAVPSSIREASYALGASKWETISSHVIPAALPGILTGTILAMARAIGETAPLITIGALTYIAFDPTGPRDIFTVMPIQIFNWVSLPQEAFHHLASAGIIVLLTILLSLNALALYIRRKMERA